VDSGKETRKIKAEKKDYIEKLEKSTKQKDKEESPRKFEKD